jgi:class 3 adenylate cyclase/predicted ATPase
MGRGRKAREETALHPQREDSPGTPPAAPNAMQSALDQQKTVIGPLEPASESQPSTDDSPVQHTEPAPPSVDWAPPTSFGRYRVCKALGAGGFGTVYLGHDTQLNRPVAIKVLHSGPDVPQRTSEHFLEEARRVARLRHPGIVAVHDVGEQDGLVYIVSDFLDGPSLDEWLKNNRPNWREAIRMVAALADAIGHAHANLTVHRDVKPANIILTADGTPVLVDFGLGLDESAPAGLELGVIAGTPAYMSPEQVSGTAHRIDGRTDIYSLGVVLYEMLCGRLPFRASDSRELMRQVRDDEPQPPRQLIRELPPELEKVCLKALAKRMQDRHTSASDFAEDLRRVLQTAADTGQSTSTGMALVDTAQRYSPALQPAFSRAGASALSSSERRVREAERRQVTVLVCGCELLTSEEFLEGVEAEEQAQVLRALHQTSEHDASLFDGTVVQANEEGVVICFGYPLAYEDAARRAAQVGLNILADIEPVGNAFLLRHKMQLRPWVAIHTGPAVVQTEQGAISLVGEARNVAVRLGEQAEPGQVLCSEATRGLIKGFFECEPLGSRKIKGVSRAVGLFLIRGVDRARSPIEAAGPIGLTPLIGRDQEFSLLKDRWEQAQEGMGQVVLLIGEPGLGKSRLVDTLKQYVQEQTGDNEEDAPVIEWRCSPHRQNTGLYPAVDFYERALAFGREESPQARFDRMLSRLEQYDLARPEVVPLWASLLSLPIPDRFPPISLTPARQREETFRVMLEWLHTRAERRPTLFVVEDLHWVDPSTLEFLGQFLAEGLHDRVLTLLTFRPEFQTPWPALDHQTSLALTRLTRRQVGDLVRKKAGADLPEALVDQVYDRAGGVPLFVEEFTKMVQESGAAEEAGEGGPRESTLLAREIPSTLQDLVMARLDRMEGGRETAQLAAVLGREFGYDLLSAVATVDDAALQADLASLVKAQILYQKGRPPRCTYIFKHALLEDALYNALVKGKRQQFHNRIVDVLEERFPETALTQPDLLAHHATEAGLTEKAIGYWLKAGLRSRERSAEVEAIGHLTKGLALLRTIEVSTIEATPERDVLELQFVTTLGPAYIAVRGYAAPEVGPVLLRARELCQRIGDRQQLFGIMLGMWEWRLVRGDLRLSVDLAADGMALAESLNDPGMKMEALFMRGVTMFYRAQFEGARVCYERAISAYDDRERTKFWTAYSGHNAGVTHRGYLALTLWHLGYPDQAAKVDREARELARTIGHVYSLGHAVDFTAFFYHYCRLATEVEAAADEEMTIGTEQGFQLWRALATLHKGAALLLNRRHADALPILLKGFEAFRATGAEVRIPSYLGLLGDAYTQSARFDDAHAALNEGLAVVEKNDDRCHEAELCRLQGELVLAESPDQAGAAEVWLSKAIDTARLQRSRAWELRATMSLARLWERQGRRADARAALATVYGAFTEGFTTPDLVDAAALLEVLA